MEFVKQSGRPRYKDLLIVVTMPNWIDCDGQGYIVQEIVRLLRAEPHGDEEACGARNRPDRHDEIDGATIQTERAAGSAIYTKPGEDLRSTS